MGIQGDNFNVAGAEPLSKQSQAALKKAVAAGVAIDDIGLQKEFKRYVRKMYENGGQWPDGMPSFFKSMFPGLTNEQFKLIQDDPNNIDLPEIQEKFGRIIDQALLEIAQEEAVKKRSSQAIPKPPQSLLDAYGISDGEYQEFENLLKECKSNHPLGLEDFLSFAEQLYLENGMDFQNQSQKVGLYAFLRGDGSDDGFDACLDWAQTKLHAHLDGLRAQENSQAKDNAAKRRAALSKSGAPKTIEVKVHAQGPAEAAKKPADDKTVLNSARLRQKTMKTALYYASDKVILGAAKTAFSAVGTRMMAAASLVRFTVAKTREVLLPSLPKMPPGSASRHITVTDAPRQKKQAPLILTVGEINDPAASDGLNAFGLHSLLNPRTGTYRKATISSNLMGAAAMVMAPVAAVFPNAAPASVQNNEASLGQNGQGRAARNAAILVQPTLENSCSAEKPLFFDGMAYNFILDDPGVCTQVLRALPATGETSRLNENTSITANESGSFTYRISGTTIRPECLTNARSRYERRVTNAGLTCEMQFDDSVELSRSAWRATIEASLASSLPIDFLAGKWFLESRGGTLLENLAGGSAFGANQWMPESWTDWIVRRGHSFGMSDIQARLTDIARDNNRIDHNVLRSESPATNMQKLARTPEARALFRQYAGHADYARLSGASYTAYHVNRIQNLLEDGTLAHPYGEGQTTFTYTMAYNCHQQGPNACDDYFAGYAANPDATVYSVIGGTRAYDRNRNLFETVVFKRNEDGTYKRNSDGDLIVAQRVRLTFREAEQKMALMAGMPATPITNLRDEWLPTSMLAANQNKDNQYFFRFSEAVNVDFIQDNEAITFIAFDNRLTPPGDAPILRFGRSGIAPEQEVALTP